MSTVATVKCRTCEKKFKLYWSQLPEKPFKCPHCLANMSDYMANQVLLAMGSVADANVEINKLHLQDKEPLFEVSVTYDGSVKK